MATVTRGWGAPRPNLIANKRGRTAQSSSMDHAGTTAAPRDSRRGTKLLLDGAGWPSYRGTEHRDRRSRVTLRRPHRFSYQPVAAAERMLESITSCAE